MSTPNKPTGITNELAKERNRAAERTLTSGIQNCLTIIGFGIVFEQIFTALARAFPGNSPAINLRLAHLYPSRDRLPLT